MYSNLKFNGSRLIILAVALSVVVGVSTAYAQSNEAALLIQKTPAQGGVVTPGEGVHSCELNTFVTISATPRPGYQFVCWIGDVSDPAANSTMVQVGSPKIVIAVFERSEYEFLSLDSGIKSTPGGGLLASPVDYSRAGGGGGGGGRKQPKYRYDDQPPYDDTDDDFPTPPDESDNDGNLPIPPDGENGDFPVPEPIPEPATILLLGLGTLSLLNKRRKQG